jgi:hypothetical protein
MELIKFNILDEHFAERNAQIEWIGKLHTLLAEGKKHKYLDSRAGVARVEYKDKAIREVDRAFWRECFILTNLNQYMDGEEHKKLERSMDDFHIPFTSKNVRETLLRVAGDANNMLQRGIYNLFRSLSGNYRSHDAFKIQKKMIVTKCWNEYGTGINYWHRDIITDLDRCIKSIQQQQYKPNKLVGTLENHFKKTWEDAETGDFIFKRFKNGNMHIIFKDELLIQRVNEIIVQYAGRKTLGNAKRT